MMKQQILSVLPGDHPWQNTLICHDTLPSTNDTAKALAAAGAPEGTVVIAGGQSAGRGRLGRSFHAPQGYGVYLSVILRPACPPEQLIHLTCATAVSMCQAVERCCGIRPQIKWTNDLVIGSRKLGGILTELGCASGLVDWAVIGIGINCLSPDHGYPEDIQNIAISLSQAAGNSILPGVLAGYMIDSLYQMRQQLLCDKELLLQQYRQDCMTLGKQVVLLQGESRRYGTALDLDADGGLLVRFDDGSIETVCSGEISVRGLYGYA